MSDTQAIRRIFRSDDECGQVGTSVYSYIYGSGVVPVPSYEDVVVHFYRNPKALAYIALDSDAIRHFIADRKKGKKK